MRIASLLFAMSAPALAQSTVAHAEEVRVPCPYEPGASRSWTKQSTGSAGVSTHTVHVTVVDTTDALVTFEVDRRLVSLDALDPVMEHVSRALDAQTVRPKVHLDRATSSLTLANGEALQSSYVAAGDAAVASLRAAGAPDAVTTMVPQLLADPARMHESVLRDLKPILSLACTTLTPGETTYRTELPSPFGTGPLPARGTLTVSVASDGVVVTNREAIDGPSLQQSAMQAMTGMAVQLEGASEADKQAALKLLGGVQFEAGTELRTTLEPTTGWALRSVSTRTVRGPGQERLDQVTFELVTP